MSDVPLTPLTHSSPPLKVKLWQQRIGALGAERALDGPESP